MRRERKDGVGGMGIIGVLVADVVLVVVASMATGRNNRTITDHRKSRLL